MICHDCKGHNDEYMVRPEVWAQAWPTYQHDKKILLAKVRDGKLQQWAAFLLLCLDCLERRLGRPLSEADFDFGIVINRPLALGFAIGLRRAQMNRDGVGANTTG